jgi:hypothetical protein
MTDVQKILKDLRIFNKTNCTVECYQSKNMNNGYYKLWLTNGKYSYVTDENFLKIEPYIRYKEKIIESPVEKLIETLINSYTEYMMSQLIIK